MIESERESAVETGHVWTDGKCSESVSQSERERVTYRDAMQALITGKMG